MKILQPVHAVEIVYRLLANDDLDKYREIRLRSLKEFPDYFGSTYEEEVKPGSMWLAGAIKGTDPDNFVFGAFAHNDQLIGICGFIRQTRVKTRHRGDLIQLFVDPLFSGKGVGRKLMNLVIEKAFENDEIELITLGVVNINEHAIKMYRQAGFVEYGKMENYFKYGDKYFTQLLFVLSRQLYRH